MTQPKDRPFSIRIFLPDGTSDGLRVIEKSNWSCIEWKDGQGRTSKEIQAGKAGSAST